jgi:hypothetical protein
MFLSKLRSWQTKLFLPTDELKVDGQHSNATKDAKRWEMGG